MSVDVSKATPAMQRYLELKAQYPDTLLLCRIGDFYELFYQDAETASRVLGITLTSRDKGSANPIPMAGFPTTSSTTIWRASCPPDIVRPSASNSKTPRSEGIVRRDVTRVVTPGTLTDESLLDPRESNYLAAVSLEKDRAGLAWLELSTGRFPRAGVPRPTVGGRTVATGACRTARQRVMAFGDARRAAPRGCAMLLTRRPPWSFAANHTRRVLTEHFGVASLEGFGWDDPASEGITAAGVLLEYAFETQKSALTHLESLEPYVRGTSLIIDDATRRSLELTRTIREGKRDGSLLECWTKRSLRWERGFWPSGCPTRSHTYRRSSGDWTASRSSSATVLCCATCAST